MFIPSMKGPSKIFTPGEEVFVIKKIVGIFHNSFLPALQGDLSQISSMRT